jgi:cyclopropane-fatty-acyl-phospholipid synthase
VQNFILIRRKNRRFSMLRREEIIPHKKSMNFLCDFFRNKVFQLLKQIQYGQLIIQDGDNIYSFGEKSNTTVHITVHNPRFYQSVVLGGSIGAAESYILGEWTSRNLTDFIRLMTKNIALTNSLESGLSTISVFISKIYHFFRSNHINMSRRNIHYHYDLSNEFFKLFLDKSMMYSSAIFPAKTSTLEEAAEFKLKTICDKLELTKNDHLLEIGTGWGGFAIYAAKHYGCHVTTTTISEAQYQYALQKIKENGLENKITLLLQDYRVLKGTYDKLVSIEMLEAVGHAYYKTYLKTCNKLLKLKGKMLIQTITIADQYYEPAKNRVDFIQRYIFPGSCIPSVTVLINHMTKYTNLRLVDLQDIGLDYALTLRHWRDRFFSNLPAVKQLGFNEQFIRLWGYYLSYSEAGFDEQHLGDMQMLLVKGN